LRDIKKMTMEYLNGLPLTVMAKKLQAVYIFT